MIPKKFFITNIIIASSCGFAMNFLLLYLLFKKTPSAMRSYARIMRVHCINDILYDLTHLITGVNPTPIGGKVYLITQGFFTHVDLEYSRVVFSMFFWAVLVAIALLPIDFIYRYLSVCRNRELSSKSIYVMVFVAYFVTWMHAFPNSYNYLIIGPSPNSTEYSHELGKFDKFKGDIPSYGVTQLGSTKSLSNFIFILILNSFVYTVIGYTSIKIYRTLKINSLSVQSSKTRELQKQVSKILALQATLPLIIICIPTVIIVLLALTNIDVPEAGGISIAFLCWLSCFKPAATILVVPKYREFVRMKVFGFRNMIHSSKSALTTITQDSTINEDHSKHFY